MYTTGSDDATTVSGTELIQVIVPCVAIPVLVGVLLLVIHLCRRYRASAAGATLKPPQATRRQHGTPSVAANNAVGLYIYSKRLYTFTMTARLSASETRELQSKRKDAYSYYNRSYRRLLNYSPFYVCDDLVGEPVCMASETTDLRLPVPNYTAW